MSSSHHGKNFDLPQARTLPKPSAVVSQADLLSNHGGVTDHSANVGGIVPGYSGFVPGAAHKVGGAACGGTKGSKGPQRTAIGAACSDVSCSSAHGATIPSHRGDIGGIVPGYAGFVPRAQHTYGGSAYGKVTTGITQGNRSYGETKAQRGQREPASNRETKAVIPGYKGYISRSQHRVGSSAFASPDKASSSPSRPGSASGGQFTRPHDGQGIVSGYRGHVPSARDKIGGSFCGGSAPPTIL